MKIIKKLIPILTAASASCCAIVPIASCSKQEPTNFLEWDCTKGVWVPKIPVLDLTPFESAEAITARYFQDISQNNQILCEDYMYRFYSGNICGDSAWDYVSILVKDINSEKQTISVEFTANGWTEVDDEIVYSNNVIDFNNFKMFIDMYPGGLIGTYNAAYALSPIHNVDPALADVEDWAADTEWSLSFKSNRTYLDGETDLFEYESNSTEVGKLTDDEDKKYFKSIVNLMFTGTLYMGGAYIED